MRHNEWLGLFVDRCGSALGSLYAAIVSSSSGIDPGWAYSESLQHVVRMLAVMIAAEQMPERGSSREPILAAAQALRDAMDGCPNELAIYRESCRAAFEATEYGIFALGNDSLLADETFAQTAVSILRPRSDVPIGSIYFQTMPLSWLGWAYQGLLAFRPAKDGDRLESSHAKRKDRGVYFTPPSLVSYIIDSVISPLIENGPSIASGQTNHPIRVLDPAMGGGDFLSGAISRLSGADRNDGARIAAECIYGVDIDPVAVEVSRFCVWASSRFASGISQSINSHLVCADALGTSFNWQAAFPQVFSDSDGFDAVVGNPPYIAAKNGLSRSNTRGQSDSYLLFLNSAMRNGLVRPGGMLSMVLPDPMLVRENAAEVRRTLTSDWTILSLLHISGAFREAQVANIVPVCRNAKPSDEHFLVSRIERLADRRNFVHRPHQTFQALARKVRWEMVRSQARYELLYLLEEGRFGEVIRRIHGDNAALGVYQEPYVPLKNLNVKTTYRGEEVGKSAIGRESGDLPMILGGQSIRPYEILWEGFKTSQSRVKKPIGRYHSTKIMLQKSSARLVAALDRATPEHPGFVFPQSVYGIELRKPGIDELYLLCILNSKVMNEYIRRTVTG
ncbi:MAG: Eco57I restriction-modification methylase domain-containing protein, partial [Armatimonadota bacterium]